jgi:hypothetical protein
MLIGPIMHRRIHGTRIPPDLPERVVDLFWSGFGLTQRPPKEKKREAEHAEQ